MFSHREGVSIANPYGPTVREWKRVVGVMEHAASLRRDGETTGFETVAGYVTPELAYVVRLERLMANKGGGEEIAPYALRATMNFLPEDGAWKVAHRHADPITTAQPAESMIKG